MVWWVGGAWWGSIGGWKVSAGVHSLQQHKQRPPSFGEAKWMTMMLTPMAVLNNGDGDVFGRATLGEAVFFWWLVWLVLPEPHWGPRRRHTVSPRIQWKRGEHIVELKETASRQPLLSTTAPINYRAGEHFLGGGRELGAED